MSTAGYSGRPLAAKLGIKPGMRLHLLHAPADYIGTLGVVIEAVTLANELAPPLDCVQGFFVRRDELAAEFPALKAALVSNGMLWVSWPKAAARRATDLNDNVVRAIGLANGLVDVKICAVDATWSAMKFVYRLTDREPVRAVGG